ncbi:MAG: ribonuclease P protein component [Pseudomonadota bacterium]
MPSLDQSSVRRLKKRGEFLFVRAGQSERRKALVVQARRRSESGVAGVGFTATRKIGSAVIRNRAKRRLRAAAQELMLVHALAGVDYVFIARASTADIAWPRLLDDMKSALISLAGTFGGVSEMDAQTHLS